MRGTKRFGTPEPVASGIVEALRVRVRAAR